MEIRRGPRRYMRTDMTRLIRSLGDYVHAPKILITWAVPVILVCDAGLLTRTQNPACSWQLNNRKTLSVINSWPLNTNSCFIICSARLFAIHVFVGSASPQRGVHIIYSYSDVYRYCCARVLAGPSVREQNGAKSCGRSIITETCVLLYQHLAQQGTRENWTQSNTVHIIVQNTV
jgi:hypothetical protein